MENVAKEQILKGVEDFIGKLKAETKKAVSFEYTSRRGIIYSQEPGTYNDPMVRAMASDIFYTAAISGLSEADKLKMLGWGKTLSDLNYTVMRMYDDERGSRPLIPFDYTVAKSMLKELIDFSSRFKGDEKMKPLLDMAKKWAEKLANINTWALCIEQIRDIKECKRDSECRAYDNDGNQIEGLSDEDESAVKAICSIRYILVRVLTKLPATSDIVEEVISRLEAFDIYNHAVLEGKTDQLEYLLKCQEAAAEFEE